MDRTPVENKTTQLESSPPSIDLIPSYKRKPPVIRQMGRTTSYISTGDDLFTSCVRPSIQQLSLWDSARRKEPILFDGLQKMVGAVRAKYAGCSHPDPIINTFVNRVLENRILEWVGSITNTMLWSGFCVGEIVHEYKTGINGEKQVWIKDFFTYHPIEPRFILNKQGLLTHGELMEESSLSTGIWVPAPEYLSSKRAINHSFTGSHVRLPKTKVFHIAFNSEGNNPYGMSQLEAATKYHIYKETFLEMEAAALDRYGTPLIYCTVPLQKTKESVQEPDGSIRDLYYHEVISNHLADLRSQQTIVLSYADKDNPPKLEALTTGNNFSDTFNMGIELCDSNMMIALGIPNLILKDNNQGLGTGGAAERQMEAFHLFITDIFNTVTNKIIEQVITPLILWNFDIDKHPLATQPVTFLSKPIRWSENQVLVNVIKTLTELNYINPEDPKHKAWVLDMFNIPK
jgi:hypothetical protein